ncbi:hypothetical protein ACLFWW_004148 [Cronobacter sakazakii]
MTSSDVLELTHQKPGQDVFLEYRRTPNLLGQALPDTRRLATFLLSFCYLFATSQTFRAAVCYFFATFLLSDCYLSLFAFYKQGTLAMYTSPRRKGAPSESRSSLRADHPRLNPTPLAINPAMPDGLASASRPHSKLRTRSPLSGGLMMAFRASAGF